MIEALTFESTPVRAAGRTLRRAIFARRTLLPAPAACHAANAVREHLGRAIDASFEVELSPPFAPGSRTWESVAAGAIRYDVRGRTSDAFLVFRRPDARRLLAHVFGGDDFGAPQAPSAIELRVLDRIASEIAAQLQALCGETAEVTRSTDGPPPRCDGYFEVCLGAPLQACVGIGVERDGPALGGATLRPHDLLDLELELRVEAAGAALPFERLAKLELGAVLPMDTKVGARGALKLGERVIARGECGSVAGRAAFIVSESSMGVE